MEICGPGDVVGIEVKGDEGGREVDMGLVDPSDR